MQEQNITNKWRRRNVTSESLKYSFTVFLDVRSFYHFLLGFGGQYRSDISNLADNYHHGNIYARDLRPLPLPLISKGYLKY